MPKAIHRCKELESRETVNTQLVILLHNILHQQIPQQMPHPSQQHVGWTSGTHIYGVEL